MTQKRMGLVRQFNRFILNPITRLFAGRFYYSLVYHVGRHSGKAFSTPIVAEIFDGNIFIPLPYGADTDWLLNVQAANNCKIMNHGQLYVAINPKIVDPVIANPAFSRILQKTLSATGTKQFLQLQIDKS